MSATPGAGGRSGPAATVTWWWLARAVAVSLALALLLLRSLGAAGYLLQVDIVFGPHPAPLTLDFSTPEQLLLIGLVDGLGGALAGKVFALLTVFLCAFCPMVLFRREPWPAQAAAGLLGVLNPWTYDRLVEGQWGVAIAAAGLFLWLDAWERLRATPRLRVGVWLGVLSMAMTSFDAHVAGPILILAVLALGWERLGRGPVLVGALARRRRVLTTVAGAIWLVGLVAGGLAFFAGQGGRTTTSCRGSAASTGRPSAPRRTPTRGCWFRCSVSTATGANGSAASSAPPAGLPGGRPPARSSSAWPWPVRSLPRGGAGSCLPGWSAW